MLERNRIYNEQIEIQWYSKRFNNKKNRIPQQIYENTLKSVLYYFKPFIEDASMK